MGDPFSCEAAVALAKADAALDGLGKVWDDLYAKLFSEMPWVKAPADPCDTTQVVNAELSPSVAEEPEPHMEYSKRSLRKSRDRQRFRASRKFSELFLFGKVTTSSTPL